MGWGGGPNAPTAATAASKLELHAREDRDSPIVVKARYRRTVASDSTEILSIFPLPTVVLFPRARVPLHIFEPRYREMTATALEGDRCIGMVSVRPEHTSQMGGDPPVFPIGCSGLVERVARRPDGRYDLVLLGTHRFRIVEEPDRGDRLYRAARVERLEDAFDPVCDAAPLQALRLEVVDVLKLLVEGAPARVAARLDPRRFSGVDDATFVNVLCQWLEVPAAEKQGLLEIDQLLERCRRLLAALKFALAERRVSSSTDSLH